MNKQLKYAIEKFNKRKFLDCHEILEDIWFECPPSEKDFYQGLLHYAVAFHHLLDKENNEGAGLQFRKSIKKLENLEKISYGINLTKVVSSAKRCLKLIEKGKSKSIKLPRI